MPRASSNAASPTILRGALSSYNFRSLSSLARKRRSGTLSSFINRFIGRSSGVDSLYQEGLIIGYILACGHTPAHFVTWVPVYTPRIHGLAHGMPRMPSNLG